ncbi:MAG: hypothetical protein LBS79_11740 [Tannerella sp.]|jgi:hypothetical protein|nr:hypothetical protein [Tannerella sp.]
MENILILHIRFDIDAVEKKFNTGAYGMACYQTVFKNVPADLLQGCQVSMGDSRATLNGRENVCIIGLTAPERRIQSIWKTLSQNSEFLSVSAPNPLALESTFGTEPLVSDGIFTVGGERLQMWAKSAYDLLKKAPLTQPSAVRQQPAAQPRPQLQHSQPQAQFRPQQQPLRPAAPQQSRPQQQFVQASPADATHIDPTQAETLKQRNGCLTAWIFIIMLVNAGIGILILALQDNLDLSESDVTVQVLISLLIVICGILLLKWKRIGFYLMLTAYLAGIIYSLSTGGGMQSFSGILGIIILWGLLNKKADGGVSAWNQMKN